jgi:hypothetical protein
MAVDVFEVVRGHGQEGNEEEDQGILYMYACANMAGSELPIVAQ